MLPSNENLPPHLRIISKRARLEIPVSEIHFIEVFDWKCIVHCNAGVQHETNMPLKTVSLPDSSSAATAASWSTLTMSLRLKRTR